MVATETDSPWADAEWTAALLSLIGPELGGVHLRAPPGPVRDYWLDRVRQLSAQPICARSPQIFLRGDCLGGIDLGATLQHGKPVAETGMLGECNGKLVIAAMAERLPRNTVHHLCTALDDGVIAIARDGIEAKTSARITLIATDEGTEEESAHAALTDRLGLALDMTTLGIHDVDDEWFKRRDVERAQPGLDSVSIHDEHLSALASLSLSLGIDSPRSTLAAVKVARASAALRQHHSCRRGRCGTSLSAVPVAESEATARHDGATSARARERTGRKPTRQTHRPLRNSRRPRKNACLKPLSHSCPRAFWSNCKLARRACDKVAPAARALSTGIRIEGGQPGVFRGDYRRGGRVQYSRYVAGRRALAIVPSARAK